MKLPSIDRKRQLWLLLIIALYLGAWLVRGVTPSLAALGLIILCFFCELLDSSMGMGYGTTLTPVLLAFGYSPLQLVPSILFSEFLSGFASSYFHHDTGNVDFSGRTPHSRVAILLALGSVVGVVIGVSIAVEIPTRYLKLIIGLIITTAGAVIWIFQTRTFAYRTWKMFILASIASFNKALSGGGYGPLMTSGQVLSGIHGKASVGITSFAEGFTCFVGVILFLGRGQGFDLDLMIPMVTGALLSIPFSTEIVKQIDDKLFKRLIAVFTILMGLFTIYKVLFR